MSPRRLLLLGTFVLLVAGCTLGKPGITPGNYDRVRVGMTMAQVKAILGPPTSSMYLEGNAVHEDPHPGQPDATPGRRYHWQWSTQYQPLKSLDIIVEFVDGRVVSKDEVRGDIDPR